MNHIIFKNLLHFDIKLWVEKNIASLPNSFERIMKRYELGKGDYENSILADMVFSRLGWVNVSKDIKNSFWGTFTCALVKLSEENNWTYSSASRNKCTDSMYSFDNDYNIMYCSWNPDTERWGKFPLSKKKFGEKISSSKNIHQEKIPTLLKEFPEFRELSNICDSIANFMPCPDYPFNSVKGCLDDVKDYLNLMIDKIQNCIDTNQNLIYYIGENQEEIKLEKVSEWKEWFIKNQKVYHLTDYYFIENEKIVGKPLFENQSLLYPMPLEKEEIRNCVKETIKRINNRANSISNDLK
ncbi:hypothetical protein VBD025_00750 [Virgibacillus flavescens]|uniref:hypothetical protein n=1 Tax=Virgibacillus flavescens TaxID=1611422 RepID=UPI003D32E226